MHKAMRRLLGDRVYLLDRVGNNPYGSPIFQGPGTGPLRARVRWDEELIQSETGEEIRSAGTVTIDHAAMPATKGAINLGGDDVREVLKIHGPKVEGGVIDHLKIWFGPQIDASQVQA